MMEHVKKSKDLKCSVSNGGKWPDVCGVYTITAPKREVYVGSSRNCYRRWYTHSGKLRRHEHDSPNLQAVADLYGEATLVFEVIEELPENVLLEAEQCLIDHLKAEGRVVLNQEPATGTARNSCLTPHLQPKRVRGTHLKTGEVIEFLSTQEAGRNGFDPGNVSAACRGILNAHHKHGGTNIYKGYRWNFID